MNLMLMIPVITLLLLKVTDSMRLHKLFQFVDGYKSEHNLLGFLHVGNDYTVFLRVPNAHDKYLVYELYESRNVPDAEIFKPTLLAISKVPVAYIKSQLKTFRNELYKSKYIDDSVIPGTQVKTLREWQIARALKLHNNKGILESKLPILRTIL